MAITDDGSKELDFDEKIKTEDNGLETTTYKKSGKIIEQHHKVIDLKQKTKDQLATATTVEQRLDAIEEFLGLK